MLLMNLSRERESVAVVLRPGFARLRDIIQAEEISSHHERNVIRFGVLEARVQLWKVRLWGSSSLSCATDG